MIKQNYFVLLNFLHLKFYDLSIYIFITMASFAKIISHPKQSQSQAIEGKKIFFDTEMSQEPQCQDKQFSPWIKKCIILQPSSQPQRSTPHQRNIQFLSSIKQRKSNIYTPQSTKQQQKNDFFFSHHNLSRDFQAKAEQKFKQLIKKSFKQKREFQNKFRLSQRAKHVNLNLNWDARPNLSITPIMRSSQHRKMNHSHQEKNQICNFKKPTRYGSNCHERKLSHSSQQNRFSILKTQQLFYKTLELSLPIQSTKKTPQTNFINKKSASKKSMAFPAREKDKSRQLYSNQSNQDNKEYKVMGEGINFTSSRGFNRSRRHNLKQSHQIQNQQHQETLFFKL